MAVDIGLTGIITGTNPYKQVFVEPCLLSASRGYSVGGWGNVRTQAPPYNTYQAFLSRGSSINTGRPFWIGMNTTPVFNIIAFNSISGTAAASTNGAIVLGDWYYCLAVFLGTAISLYVWHYPLGSISGTLMPNNAGSTGTADADIGYNSFAGCSPDGTNPLNGYLHKWIVWDCALTSMEANAIGSGGVNPATIRPRAQMMHLPFDTNLINRTLYVMELDRGFMGAHFQPTNTSTPQENVPNPPVTGMCQQFGGLGCRNYMEFNGWGGAGQGRLGGPLPPFPTMLSIPPIPGHPRTRSMIFG